ncbi:S-layer homology domain-containing protein [Paenibacillus sp. BC26]|uniref:S-layer homology domain-containing protein n=1 Tax=Paenibacillus sp. BC26 TaxID=1881032 RepID=UPI0008E9904E|nr:S-layer homology domain-containing protein [Paenibacillus sp. BC26]SFS57698.1 S-layer homology domain-containing protein [Paenibacillus sp. BC26]
MLKLKLTAYLLVTMLLSACFSFTGAALADPATSFLLKSSPSTIKNGDSITFEISGKNVQALYAFEAKLTFDSGKLEYVSSESAIEGFMVPAIVEGNHITMAATQKGNAAVQQGNFAIGSITFKAKQTGDAAVTLQTMKLLDAKLSETVFAVNSSAAISINGTPTVSSPGQTTSTAQSDKQISKDVSGISQLTVTTKTSYLLQQLAGTEKQLTIDATASESVGHVQIELTGEVIAKAAELGKPILIQSNGVQLQFDPSSFKVKNGDAVKLSWSTTGNLPGSDDLQQISGVFDFDLSVDGKPVHAFSKPVKVQFTVEAAQIEDEDKVGVYYFNKATKKWEYVGGTLTNDHTVSADLDHFSPYAVLESDKSFSDIQGHWAQAAIERMAAKQIVNGVSEQLFQPNATVTRAQFVSMIARALKLPAASASSMGAFTDVSHSAWYMDSVYAANQAGITKGTSATTFAPDAVITREQMAQIVVQAYLYANGGAKPDPAAASTFTDQAAISGWASDSVQLAAQLNLIKGFTDGSFGPQLQATRAQAAEVIDLLLNTTN